MDLMSLTPIERPLAFSPVFQRRVWGGRALESCLGKTLPGPELYGESWEIVDRPEAQSMVRGGALSGVSLNYLWRSHGEDVFRKRTDSPDRFPLLVKILDARENLSVQVHPNEAHAALGLGEPKSEWWYVLDARPGAVVYAGFQPGVCSNEVQHALHHGGLERLLHRIPVRTGDSIFVPGGRCHAIGAGCLITEVQQNSDTTYRVFDWNRVDSFGARRRLHLAESLACMDFNDSAPELNASISTHSFECDFFSVSCWRQDLPVSAQRAAGSILMVLNGSAVVAGIRFERGEFLVVPACASSLWIEPSAQGVAFLQIDLPNRR